MDFSGRVPGAGRRMPPRLTTALALPETTARGNIASDSSPVAVPSDKRTDRLELRGLGEETRVAVSIGMLARRERGARTSARSGTGVRWRLPSLFVLRRLAGSRLRATGRADMLLARIVRERVGMAARSVVAAWPREWPRVGRRSMRSREERAVGGATINVRTAGRASGRVGFACDDRVESWIEASATSTAVAALRRI